MIRSVLLFYMPHADLLVICGLGSWKHGTAKDIIPNICDDTKAGPTVARICCVTSNVDIGFLLMLKLINRSLHGKLNGL